MSRQYLSLQSDTSRQKCAAAAAAATDVDALVVVALALEEMTPILCQLAPRHMLQR